MIYRNLGNSGLKVSAISFGNMINYKPENQEIDQKLINTCIEKGINFFDTSERYASGQAQTALGKYIKGSGVERENIVVATKVWICEDPEINSNQCVNRKHIRESVAKSLKRLQLDYVDLIYAHEFDQETPLEEICRGFHEIIEQGKAFYWGVCNFGAQIIFEIFQICEKLNLHKPVVSQIQYNMLQRTNVEVEYRKLIQTYNFGIVGWSPLVGGLLTGKYANGIPEKQLNRFTQDTSFTKEFMKEIYLTPYENQKTQAMLKKLAAFAEKLQCKMTHLAIAWVLKLEKGISSALTGARNSEQLEDSLKALEVLPKLTPQILKELEEILGTRPAPQTNFITRAPRNTIR